MKKILKIMTSFFMVLTLTGCMKMNIDLDFSDAENPKMSMKILYSKEMMNQYNMSIDDLKNSDQLKDFETKTIEETIDDKEYQGVQATVPQKEMSEVSALLKKENDTYTLSLPITELTKDLDADEYENMYSASSLKALGVEFTFKITMPGEIIKTDAGMIDGRSVTIDLLDVMDKKMNTLTVQSKADESNNTLLYVGIGVLIIAAIIAFVFMKKKKTNQEQVTESKGETEEPKVQEQVSESKEETEEPKVQEQVSESKEETEESKVQEQVTESKEETEEPKVQEQVNEPIKLEQESKEEAKEQESHEEITDKNVNEE